jgi:ABC-type Fe3+-hydroxamate transport system substrate-binding protein
MDRRYFIALGAATLAYPLVGCGTTEEAVQPQASTSAAGTITVTDGRGKQVTLAKPASRVVTLEWGNTEDLITLGVQPAGVADIKGYRGWVSSAAISGTPVDVGLRGEPSLESVAEAKPDLILGIMDSIPESAMAQLEKIAPVVVLKGADAKAPFELMRQNFITTAKLLGKDAEAATILAELDARITAARAKVESAGKAGAPYVFAYIYETGNQIGLRMHGVRSQPGYFVEQLGLKNAWSDPGDDQWGLSDADIEALTKLPANTEFLYWGNSDSDPVNGTLAKNGVWKGLGFVRNGNVTKAADKIWVYGGPASMGQWVDDVATAITG